MSDATTLLELRDRIRRLKAQRGQGTEPEAARVYTITGRRYYGDPPPWPPTEAELAASGQEITRYCTSGCGDIIAAAPPCPHEREALDHHHGPNDRADLGNEHYQEIDP